MVATSISQSKELLRLELPAETADCNWNTTFGEWALCVGKNNLPHAVPAWSLAALTNLFPFPKAVDEPIFKLTKGCVSFDDMTVSWPNKWIARFWGCKGIGKTQVDAVVNLIVTLYDNGIKLW